MNAIRTSHNPPDPALLDFCDHMGFLVMDEAFDEWTPMKNKWVTGRNDGEPADFGYGENFDQWGVVDLQDIVRRDRNHPSIILWSIGNEIDFANDPFSDPVLGAEYRPENPPAKNMVTLAKPLIAAVKALDRTRPVTAALATVSMSDAVGLAALLDADGYNYQEQRYAADHRKYPRRIIYGSENSTQYGAWLAVETKPISPASFSGPARTILAKPAAGQIAPAAPACSTCAVSRNRSPGSGKVSGVTSRWFISASSAGAASAEGGVAPAARKVGIGRPNSTITVNCNANCPEVRLSLNGKVIGTKQSSEAVNGVLRWQVPFEPGKLKAVGRANGQDVCDCVLQTAGPASRIELLPDTQVLHADGKDVCQIEFRIVDENGVRVVNAAPEVTFEMTGPAKLLGIGNGDVNNTEDCKASKHHAFQGRGLVILQTTTSPGGISLQASTPGQAAANLTLQSR